MRELISQLLRQLKTSQFLKAGKAKRATILSITILVCGLIGLAIAFPRQFEQVAEMPSVDSVHIAASALGLGVAPKHPMTLIKVDDRTQSDWGNPFPVAKARLAELIGVLRGLEPTAIIVDFDFSIERDAEDTSRFDALLSSWSPADPPLLLPAELTVLPDGTVTRKDSAINVPASAAPVFWTSVLFRKDRELKVRDWRLWEYSCASQDVLLSPQLIVAALLEGGVNEVGRVISSIEHQAGCRAGDDAGVEAPRWLVDTSVISPINYVFAKTGQPYTDSFGHNMLTEWSATDVLGKGIAAAAVKGRTVIIGASRADSGDNHATPIGQMEGMRVLANAIATGPDVFGKRSPSALESLVLSLLFAAAGIALLKRLKMVFAGFVVLVIAVLFYSITARIYGPAGAVNALSWGITLIGTFFVLESLILFLFELLHERRGWRAFFTRR